MVQQIDRPEMAHVNQTDDATQQSKRLRSRTFLIPILFLAIHWFVINVVATIYLVIAILTQSTNGNPLDAFTNPTLINQMLTDHYPLITVISSLFLLPIYLIYLMMQRKKDNRVLLLDPSHAREIFPALAVTVGLLGIINLWFVLLTEWREQSVWIDRLMDDYAKTAAAFTPENGYLWLILGIGIMTPIAEELLFRGIIQGELRKVIPEWAAILVQGLIFALFHMQPIQISYVILPAMLLGLLYAWTRSIWVPILMHVAFNLLGSVLPSLIGSDTVMQQIISISQLAFILIGVLCLIYLYRNRKSPAVVAIK